MYGSGAMKMAQRLVFHRFIFVFSMHAKSSKCSQEAQMLAMDTVDENVPFRPRAIVQKFWLTKSRTVERNGKAEGRLLDVARNTTKLATAEQVLEDDGETRVQNATERVSRIGLGAEALRRIHVQRLKSHLDAFYEHGSLADILLLSAAFEEAERR
jgi:hypothetical protein